MRHFTRDFLSAFFACLDHPITEGLIALLCLVALGLIITGGM